MFAVGEHEHSYPSYVKRVQLEQHNSGFDPVLFFLGLSTHSGLLQRTPSILETMKEILLNIVNHYTSAQQYSWWPPIIETHCFKDLFSSKQLCPVILLFGSNL